MRPKRRIYVKGRDFSDRICCITTFRRIYLYNLDISNSVKGI